MTGVQDSTPAGSQPVDPATNSDMLGYIDPFAALPLADPATLPAATLSPEELRALRDHADPITAHRTRRNR